MPEEYRLGWHDSGLTWEYWTCHIRHGEDGYGLVEWRVEARVRSVEGGGQVRIEDKLTDLLAFCDTKGMAHPDEIQVFFSIGSLFSLSRSIDPPDGSSAKFSLDRATGPTLRRIHDRWGRKAAQYAQAQVRDSERWFESLTERIAELEDYVATSRNQITEYLDAVARGVDLSVGSHAEWLGGIADDEMLRDFGVFFRERYARGDYFNELNRIVDRWYKDAMLAFAMLEHRAGTA